MPAALDLIGRKFGSLTVISLGPRVKYGKMQRSWVCLCECGAEMTVPQGRLQTGSFHRRDYVTACDACRSRPCEICGAAIPPISASTTCSPECGAEKHRRYTLNYYHAVLSRNAEYMDIKKSRARAAYANLSQDQKYQQNKKRRLREIEMHGAEAIRERGRPHWRRYAEQVRRNEISNQITKIIEGSENDQ